MHIKDKYTWSIDREIFNEVYDSFNEALHHAKEYYEENVKNYNGNRVVPKKVFIGQLTGHSFSDFVNVDEILDLIYTNAVNEIGFYPDFWMEDYIVPDAAYPDFIKVLDEWATRHNLQPQFHSVKNIKEIKLDE